MDKLALAQTQSEILSNRKGQATFEYLFLLFFALGVIILINKTFISKLDDNLLVFGKDLENNLQTGRLRDRVWQN